MKVCILEVEKRRGKNYYTLIGEGVYYDGFVLVKEATRDNPLPEGIYAVRYIEDRQTQYGTYPYLSLIKPLNLDDLLELSLQISELLPNTQKEIVKILDGYYLKSQRLKNILNVISINDRKELLFEEEPGEDEILKALEIDIKKVKEVYHEILRDRQEGQSENLQGGLPPVGEGDKRQKRAKAKLGSTRKSKRTVDSHEEDI
ncbi:MAG: hypothetical protein QW733_01930 [Desulfurococcaceae archaeon]